MLQLIKSANASFTTCDQARPLIQQACADNPAIASYEQIGTSEEGRPIDAVVLGTGPKRVSLIAGAHSDEPLGPETLRSLVLQLLAKKERFRDLLETYQFLVVPHINPDGEARNEPWKEAWPSVEAYLRHAFREPPGRDLEFGFPHMRLENTHVADFLIDHAPFVLHASLHGMSFAEGVLLLIERHWIDRTQRLRGQFERAVGDAGLGLHDHDRKGEKGFLYIAPGFSTTPEGSAMRRHFEGLGDKETASLFHHSSMEFVRTLGGDPLCLVTEVPLFVIGKRVAPGRQGVPQAYLDFRNQLPELRRRLHSRPSQEPTPVVARSASDEAISPDSAEDKEITSLRSQRQQGSKQPHAVQATEEVSPIAATLNAYQIKPVQLAAAMRLQLYAIQLGLEALERAS